MTDLDASMRYLNERGQDDLAAYLEKATHLASLLFVTGAPHSQWKAWQALVGFGHYASGDWARARQSLALADAMPLPRAAQGEDAEKLSVEDQVILRLIEGGGDELPSAKSPYAVACQSLLVSIPNAMHDKTESALVDMSEFWIEMCPYLESPNPEISPEFEPKICALAALARRRGYKPLKLPRLTAIFLEPGLAESEPRAWIQEFFSQDGEAGHR